MQDLDCIIIFSFAIYLSNNKGQDKIIYFIINDKNYKHKRKQQDGMRLPGAGGQMECVEHYGVASGNCAVGCGSEAYQAGK